MKMSKKVLALCAAICVSSALFAEILVDATLALPINGNKVTINKVDGEKIDGDVDPVTYSTLGLGLDINAIVIEEGAFMGFGGTLGLNFPLSLKTTDKDGEWYKITHSKTSTKDGSEDLPEGASFGAFGIDVLVGPALRLLDNDKMSLFVTPGLYLGYVTTTTKMEQTGSSAKSSQNFFDLGFGANVSFSYDITDKLFIKAGLLGEVGFSFASFPTSYDGEGIGSDSFKSSGSGLSYGFRPQIGVGYKF